MKENGEYMQENELKQRNIVDIRFKRLLYFIIYRMERNVIYEDNNPKNGLCSGYGTASSGA